VKTNKTNDIEIFVTPITRNGNLTTKFSENLKVPKLVESLLSQREERQLSEVDSNQSYDKVNETLDAYIIEVFEIRAMQFYEENGTYRENNIDFNPHLITWNE